MRHLCFLVLLLFWAACGYAQSNSYLFVWAGDDAKRSSDFLAVLDADSKSPHYGQAVASVAVPGPSGTPHHTELEMRTAASCWQMHLRAGAPCCSTCASRSTRRSLHRSAIWTDICTRTLTCGCLTAMCSRRFSTTVGTNLSPMAAGWSSSTNADISSAAAAPWMRRQRANSSVRTALWLSRRLTALSARTLQCISKATERLGRCKCG